MAQTSPTPESTATGPPIWGYRASRRPISSTLRSSDGDSDGRRRDGKKYVRAHPDDSGEDVNDYEDGHGWTITGQRRVVTALSVRGSCTGSGKQRTGKNTGRIEEEDPRRARRSGRGRRRRRQLVDHARESPDVDRFGQVQREAGLQGAVAIDVPRVSGDRDDRDRRATLEPTNLLGDLVPAQPREADIEEHELGRGSSRQLQGLVTAERDLNFVTEVSQAEGHHLGRICVVVDDQDAARAVRSS